MTAKKWEITMPYTDRGVTTREEGGTLSVGIDDARYTVVVCRKSEAALPEHFYSLRTSASAEGLSYRFLYIFCNAEGRELAKGYFMEGRRVVSPANTARVTVEVLITAKRGGTLRVEEATLLDGGAYQKRTARVVALSSYVVSDPASGWTRSYRTSVEETLASIDLVAEREHPDMIVLTENVFQTRTSSEEYYRNYNRLDGSDPDIAALCERARKYRTYIVCSAFVQDEDSLFYNTGLLIDREGHLNARYRKCHLTIGELEKGICPGDELCVFDTDFAKIGIQICWDQYFPESVRALAMQGAELICAPTHGSHIERAVTRARENGVWLACAYTAREQTFITAPGMEPLLDTGEGKGYAVAEIDFNDPERRRYLSCNSYGAPYEYYMCERREDLYGMLTKRMP